MTAFFVSNLPSVFWVSGRISYSYLSHFCPKDYPTTYFRLFAKGNVDARLVDMTTKTTSTLVNTADNLIPSLGSRWRSAEQIAQTYGRSRPWVYAIADRFKLRSVSLAETGKVGARLFDAFQMENLLEELAEIQKDQPRVNPRAKTKGKA